MTSPPRPPALLPLDERAEEVRATIEAAETRAIFDRAMNGIDRAKFEKLQSQYRNSILEAQPSAAPKYIDLPRWFLKHGLVFQSLGLHRTEPQHILDIGSGGGQFLHLCKQYGHEGIGLDLARPELYGDLFELFGVKRVIGGVYRGQSLPEPLGRFDLIVIHAPNFDSGSRLEDNWTVNQWAGFLEYLCSEHLDYPGRIFIRLNRHLNERGEWVYLMPLIDLAEMHGADVGRIPPRITFELDAPLEFPEIASEW